MKRAIGIVVVLAIAMLVGVTLQTDNGYVLLRYGHTAVQMSMVALAIFAIPAFIVLYWLVRLILPLFRARRTYGRYRQSEAQRKANRHLVNGFIDVSEGRWEKGENRVLRAANGPESALLAYLIAARAAQVQGAYDRRNNYLRNAYELDRKSRMAVLLSQAELQISHHQYELALATLRSIQERKPHHVQALRLLARAYTELEDYTQLHRLVAPLRSYHALDADKVDRLEINASAMLMNKAARRGDRARLQQLWHGLSRYLRSQCRAVRPYVEALIRAGAGDLAEPIIRSHLKSQWDDELVRLYGLLQTDTPASQLANAEQWLKQHDYSSMLLLTLGRLAMATELWGKARHYLEDSAGCEKRAETYAVLGELLEQQGDPDAARTAYKTALSLAGVGTITPAGRRRGDGLLSEPIAIPGTHPQISHSRTD